MQNEMFENMMNYNQSSLESFKRVAEINTRLFQRLTEKQLEATSAYLAGGVQHLEVLGKAKGLQDVVSEQAKLAADFNEKAVNYAKETAGILMEARDEFAGLVEDGVQSVQQVATRKVGSKKAA